MLGILLACSSISMSEAEFGMVWSADVKSGTIEGVQTAGGTKSEEGFELWMDPISVSTLAFGCDRSREFFSEWERLSEGVLDDIEDGEQICEGVSEFLDEFDALQTRLYSAPRSSLSLWVDSEAGREADDMEEGTYTFGEDARGYVWISDEATESEMADYWDEDACAFDWEEWGDEEDSGDSYEIVVGELEIESIVEDSSAHITVDGELFDEAGQEAGDIGANLSLGWCEIPDVDTLLWWY